ncbi:CoB--CoM heterodisulfide reductase iron-sulfur subunit A family protein [Fontisphaera persica]|uniref:CoB--CoM heterodisulfide reductase iron-sulfur subunit A family protein n=1 Tax=Fontisphaera persica TaxID=2974023 RepID=UPI0024C0BA0F|nr:CoB--CoM heterodisulfide reductase iron-sulfur subunit A family protein [Fontisphaera persica]WCJ60046.1 CoB--CoM heterodisulfide reductase iron-sulfur subunit A family protein [Fontisphaera persica]
MNHGKNNGEEIRIGFYVCHCGHNIASMVDCAEVAKYVEQLPHVVLSRDYKYMCSDPGQELIAQDIKEHNLNRIVVASCSPLLHEHTFRTAVERGGINPFYFHMVNIREHNSWVHTDRAAATLKAKALARAAIKRVAHHRALETKRVPIHPDVLVVGGGIAGIHAAMTLANAGKKVYLVEREPTIGGHMAKFDKTFPTLDCAACILTPKMSQVGAHPNIKLMTYSEVTKVDGYVGNYTVTIKHKPRYVIEDLCIGCQDCIPACVYKEPKFPDEFNENLGKRKPIYIPFPQATPQVVIIDPDTCLNLKTGKCKKTCVEACGDKKAIDFKQQETFEDIKVGTIIVATGFKTFDATKMPQYGYGIHKNVYTALEVERLVNASGPTGGEIILRDGTHPKSIGIIHCVGSRDERHNRWCSRVCCMYSLKLAHLLKEHTGAEVYNFYIDMRTAGKNYDEFYGKLLDEGVHFIRGRVGEVTDWAFTPEEEGHLVIRVEDTLAGYVRRIPVDMVVLATGLEPQEDAQEVRRLFNMSCGGEGFFLERHPKLAPVNTFTDGIFLAGCCQGPKDIPDSVAQAGAAAAEALVLVDKGYVEQEPNTAFVIENECSGCKSCVPLCPYTAIAFDGSKQKAYINEALCKGCGTCVGACPSGSIVQNLFEDAEVFSEIEGVLAE